MNDNYQSDVTYYRFSAKYLQNPFEISIFVCLNLKFVEREIKDDDLSV